MLGKRETPGKIAYPSEGMDVEAVGEEVGDVLLEEPDHGLLLPPCDDQPRPDAFEGVLAASIVQQPNSRLTK